MPPKRTTSLIEKELKRYRLTSDSCNELHLLDNLVLRNCISHLPLINGVAQERVHRQFANELRQKYSSEQVSLRIYFDMKAYKAIGEDPVIFAVELSGKRLFAEKSASKSRVESQNLRLLLDQIFKRFKCFHRITLESLHGDFIVKNVADAALSLHESSNLLDVQRLLFNPGSCTIDKAAKLITCFSSSLKVLQMRVGDDADDYACPSKSDPASKLLWSTVSNCTRLEKLIWSPIDKNEAENAYLGDCLKKLQIKLFKYNSRNFDADWLHRSFEHNERLRHLATGDVRILCAPNLRQIITRLKTLTICHGTHYTDKSDILSIAQSMNRDASIIALETVYNADHESSITSIVNALTNWLQLSHETTKYVKLIFGLFNGPLRPELVDITMEQLLARDTFDSCKLLEGTDRRKLLLWRNASVKFDFVEGYVDDSFDAW